MRINIFLNQIVSRLRKFWPRKLINKIALMNIVVLAVTIGTLSWYSLSEKLTYQIDTNSQQFSDHAQQIARLSKPFIRSQELDELEEVISSFMLAEHEYSIAIKDVGFNNLISLKSIEGDVVSTGLNSVKIIAPVETGEFIQLSDDKLEVWYQIDKDNSYGWVYISQEMPAFGGLTLSFVKNTLTALVCSIAICLLLLQRILREPMQSLRRAAEFSEWLDMAQGNHLQVRTSSQEVEHLVHTLNKTSEKMFQNGLEKKRHHMLVDAISDIQTKYIEHTKPQELYERILNRVVHLSGDEYGFFGEVKKSKKGKLYIKMRTFSKLGESVSMQNFIEQNSPPNMEFHNTHNLFGTVLQTKKPVIANDPFRDPRSGGLPKGHPPINSFMALPVFNDDGIVAIIGLANRRGGYDQLLADYLQPLLTAVGHIVVANQFNKRRKLARKNLEQREVLQRRILSTVSDSIVTINMGGFIETANPATEKMFGYLNEEMLNQHVNKIIPDIFDADFYQNYIFNGNAQHHKSEGVRKNGDKFPIEFMVSEFKIGDEKMYTVTVIDVSHLSEKESQSEKALQNADSVHSKVKAGSWEVCMKSQIIKANNEVFGIFGIEHPADKVNFKEVVDNVLIEDRPIVQLAMEQCLQNNEEFVIDVRLIGKESRQRFIQLQGSLANSTDSSSKVITGVVQDVTETSEMIRMKDEFITTVSEEIRSPLASIRGSIGALSGQIAKYVTEKEKFLLDTAYQNTDRLIMLINDILDIENIATGKTEFNMEFLECQKVLDSVMAANSKIEKDYGVTYSLNVQGKDIVLIADKYRLMQLLNIVCLNAARHSPVGAVIEINAVIDNAQLLISVQDPGEGIPEDIKSRIFDLYARTEYFRADHPESTGLGLCVAKSIVDRHKGSIDVESELGEGTTVYIRFPVPQQNVAVLSHR